MNRSLAAATGLLITMPVVATLPAHAADTPGTPAPPRVVAKDLNNPRQISYAADGKTLIVAEAGRGGEDCAELPPPVAEEPGEDGPSEAGPPCIGPTGSVTHVSTPEAPTPTVRRVIEGLPSTASPNGAFAVGTHGADEVQGEAGLHVVAQSPGLAEEPTFEDADQGVYLAFDAADVPAPGDDDGGIPGIITLPGGDVALLGADLLEAERRLNPDTAQVESNPYAILFVDEDPENPEDGYALVADAAANAVWKVAPRHEATEDEATEDEASPMELEVTVFAAYPTTEEEPGEQGEPEYVPTSLAQDADGSIFVGGLGSEVAGAAEVVQYDATGKELRRFGGFTGITGVAVDDDNIYVSQIFGSTPPAPPGPGGPESEAPPAPTTAPGSVVKTSRHSTDAERFELDVPFPGGVVTDHLGGVYVSAYSTSPAEGVTDAFGPGSLDLEGGQVWHVTFEDTPVTTPGGPDEGPAPTNGEFVPVGEEYYGVEFTSDACGQDVTVTAGDVREVQERVTVHPGDLVKRELRGRSTVDITRADGVTLDEVDVSGESVLLESKPTEDGVIKVVASLDGASIIVPFDEAGEAELVANELPPIVLWLGGNITFSDTLQLGDTPDSLPTTIETDIVNNTAVGILDVCALLDAESSATPTAIPTATASPTATPSATASPTASPTSTTTASPSPAVSPTPTASPTPTT